MHVVNVKEGIAFEASKEETLLDAAIKGNANFAYSCRTGRCGVCRCRVLEGSTRLISDESGLSAEEKSQGWILSCSRAADSDLSIQHEGIGGIELPKPALFPCRVARLTLVSPAVMKVQLRLPPATAFRFVAGQYVDVIGPEGVRRSYSIACGAPDNNVIELFIGRVEGGAMSQYWFCRAKEGDLLRLKGPHGTFVLRDAPGADLVLLATGTGIAPVKAILESLVARNPGSGGPASVTVYWGNRREEDFFEELSFQSGITRFVKVASRAADNWSDPRGHIQDILLEERKNLSDTYVYACGSEKMIADSRVALSKAGLPEGRFFYDAFVSTDTGHD
jgi:CDP-4-dehydro-6-deoxyglucose reductase